MDGLIDGWMSKTGAKRKERESLPRGVHATHLEVKFFVKPGYATRQQSSMGTPATKSNGFKVKPGRFRG
jgi:hypothetical protein